MGSTFKIMCRASICLKFFMFRISLIFVDTPNKINLFFLGEVVIFVYHDSILLGRIPSNTGQTRTHGVISLKFKQKFMNFIYTLYIHTLKIFHLHCYHQPWKHIPQIHTQANDVY